MEKLTKKDLMNLPMKQIREYALMQGAQKVPKKWQDKKTAVAWFEKNVGFGNSPKVATSKKVAKKTTSKKVAKKTGGKDDRQAIARRHGMGLKLRKEPCTAIELKDFFGNEYKSVLDDLHAIRHNRNGEDYLEEGEVLLGVYIGRVKAFQIVDKKVKAKLEKELKENIEIE